MAFKAQLMPTWRRVAQLPLQALDLVVQSVTLAAQHPQLRHVALHKLGQLQWFLLACKSSKCFPLLLTSTQLRHVALYMSRPIHSSLLARSSGPPSASSPAACNMTTQQYNHLPHLAAGQHI